MSVTDPELKEGGIRPPPCGEMAIFRRVGMSAQWRLAVSVGGFWLYSGRLDQKQITKKIRRVWAGFSVGDIRPGFRNFFKFVWVYNESCAAVTYVTRGAQIRFFFCRPNTGTSRTGAATNSCQVLHNCSSGSVVSMSELSYWRVGSMHVLGG